VAEASHRGCLIGTSRERPPEFVRLEGTQPPVRSLRLGGLDVEAGPRGIGFML
jgi:hypothetical protein